VIRDSIIPDISLDTHRRLVIDTIHRYLYYLVFIFLFFHIFISIMITDPPSCRYSCTYLYWTDCIYCVYFSILRLSVYTWRYFHSAYIRRRSVPIPAGSGRYNKIRERTFSHHSPTQTSVIRIIPPQKRRKLELNSNCNRRHKRKLLATSLV